MIIVDPFAIASTPTIAGAAGAGSGAANLLTPSPREIWVSGGVGVNAIDVDLGAAQDVGAIFLGFTNATADATWSIQKGTGLGTGLSSVVAATAMRVPGIGPRFHAFAALDVAVNTRFLRINTTQTGAVPLHAGALVIGQAFVRPYEFGGGRVPIDLGAKERLTDGGWGIGEGAMAVGLRWTFVDLDAVARQRLWRLAYSRGETRPVVVIEETGEEGDLNDERHYGLFRKFEEYAREAPGQARWALSMESWG